MDTEKDEPRKSAVEIVNSLLEFLPDSRHDEDESWGWCWDELSDDAQAKVLDVRKEAQLWLQGKA